VATQAATNGVHIKKADREDPVGSFNCGGANSASQVVLV